MEKTKSQIGTFQELERGTAMPLGAHGHATGLSRAIDDEIRVGRTSSPT